MVHDALCDNRAGALLANTVKTQRTEMQNLQMAPDSWQRDGCLHGTVLPRGTVWKRDNWLTSSEALITGLPAIVISSITSLHPKVISYWLAEVSVAAQNEAAEHNYRGPHDRLRCLEHDGLMTLGEYQLLAESSGCQCSTSDKFVLTAVYSHPVRQCGPTGLCCLGSSEQYICLLFYVTSAQLEKVKPSRHWSSGE